jgi:hypothetical protein
MDYKEVLDNLIFKLEHHTVSYHEMMPISDEEIVAIIQIEYTDDFDYVIKLIIDNYGADEWMRIYKIMKNLGYI